MTDVETKPPILQFLVNRTGTPEWVTVIVHAQVAARGVFREPYEYRGAFFDTVDGTKVAFDHVIEIRLL